MPLSRRPGAHKRAMLKKKWLQKSESCRKKLPLQRFEKRGRSRTRFPTAVNYFINPTKNKMKNIQAKQTPCFRRWSRKGWSAFASLHRHVTIGVLAATMSILLARDAKCVCADMPTRPPSSSTLRIRRGRHHRAARLPRRATYSRKPRFSTGKHRPQRPSRLWSPPCASHLRLISANAGARACRPTSSFGEALSTRPMVLLNGIDFTDARTGHQSHSLPVDLDCISAVELLDGVPGVGAYAGAVNIRTAPLQADLPAFRGLRAASTAMATRTFRAR